MKQFDRAEAQKKLEKIVDNPNKQSKVQKKATERDLNNYENITNQRYYQKLKSAAIITVGVGAGIAGFFVAKYGIDYIFNFFIE